MYLTNWKKVFKTLFNPRCLLIRYYRFPIKEQPFGRSLFALPPKKNVAHCENRISNEIFYIKQRVIYWQLFNMRATHISVLYTLYVRASYTSIRGQYKHDVD